MDQTDFLLGKSDKSNREGFPVFVADLPEAVKWRNWKVVFYRLWAALSEGGKIEQCGWLKDRYGLFWQIAPTVLGEMMKDSDRARAKRVAEAMLKMIKLDIEGLKKAYEGR